MFELDSSVLDDVPWRVFKNAPGSMRDVLALTGMHGSKEVVVYEGERLTFDEHLKLVCGLAQHLHERYDIAKGDRAAISACNYPEWIVAFRRRVASARWRAVERVVDRPENSSTASSTPARR